ncbi:hypothetical protein [Bordetella phage vB_BbrM_PHB04]|uniref:Uncharacterized protein n=1 Tax=Bordetella phage vB_BbrM_PHB04 TaxID=2029657 RepID=A0A291L9Y7_9CAUD|nr:hypothetical protein HOS14_gp072 [Bordetella phage vB_BbrM_PHB04]ATI15690.1 hypothetical protein [Bordetella phage vB_BbrM_PHB04]
MVEYFKIEGAPGQYFRCDRYSATLSVTSCAGMWRKANHEGSEQQFKCRVCPLGAVHAGETAASMSPLKGTTICGRCHRIAARLIRGHVCVSCYNREREVRIGKNAKGAKPVKVRPLSRRRIYYLEGGEPKRLELDLSAATDELIVATLRDADRHARFSFRGEIRGAPSQLRLW